MPFCLLLVILLAESVAGRECPSFHNSPAKGWRNYAGKPEGWEPRLVYLNDCSRVSSLKNLEKPTLWVFSHLSDTLKMLSLLRPSCNEKTLISWIAYSVAEKPQRWTSTICPISTPTFWPENAVFLKEMGLKNPCMKMPALTKAPKANHCLDLKLIFIFSHSRPSSISSFVSDRDSNMVELKKDFCRNRALGIR